MDDLGYLYFKNPHIPRTSAFWTTDHFAFCAGRRKGTSSCWKDWCAAAAWTSENFQSWACPSPSTQQLDFFENWQNNLLKSEDPHHVHVRLEWPYISYNIYIYNHIYIYTYYIYIYICHLLIITPFADPFSCFSSQVRTAEDGSALWDVESGPPNPGRVTLFRLRKVLYAAAYTCGTQKDGENMYQNHSKSFFSARFLFFEDGLCTCSLFQYESLSNLTQTYTNKGNKEWSGP